MYEKRVSRLCGTLLLLYRKLRRISYKVTKALREDCTAAERNLSLRDPPQAENPAIQDSIFTQKGVMEKRIGNPRNPEVIGSSRL